MAFNTDQMLIQRVERREAKPYGVESTLLYVLNQDTGVQETAHVATDGPFKDAVPGDYMVIHYAAGRKTALSLRKTKNNPNRKGE